MKFRRLKPQFRPQVSDEVKQVREKAVEAREIAEKQKKVSQRLWDELLEIRKRNNIAAAITTRWE